MKNKLFLKIFNCEVLGVHFRVSWAFLRCPVCSGRPAITIHKSQGLSIDKAYIDIGSNIFEFGQTYVALSRVKSLNGLYLKNLNINKIKANPKVIEFYKSICKAT